MEKIRIGRISKVNRDTGMVAVSFVDENLSTTGMIPYLTHGGEWFDLKIGTEVLVIFLKTQAVAMGTYWNEQNGPNVDKTCGWRKEISKKARMEYDSSKNELVIHAPSIVLEGNGKRIRLDQIETKE